MMADRLSRAWQGLRFRDALLLTFLPLLALGVVTGGAVRDYLRARLYDDWFSRAQSVPFLFESRVNAILAVPRSLRLRDGFLPEDADAGIIRLAVPVARWDSLEVERDGQWAPWLDGELQYGGSTLPVRLRKRGDNSVHWLTEKRSLSVRTPRDDFYKRFRSFALSGKDVLPSYLANRLGQAFGLVIPATEVSPVFLNNRFYGVYRFVELVDESFLRPLDRMPGNIYRGDAAERGEYYKGTNRNLFANPRIWDRASANDRWTSAGPTQLRLLLEDVAGTTFADHQRLMHRLDGEEYARLFAYLLLMGDPYHMDGVHNQMLYEDPSTQRLHPIPWDTRLRPLAKAGVPLNDLFKAVLKNPFVIDATMREVARWLERDALLGLADSLVTSTMTRYGRYLEYDKLRTGLIPDVGDSAVAMQTLRANTSLLKTWLTNDTVAVAAVDAGGLTVVDVETRGRVGATLKAIKVDRVVTGDVSLRLDANLNGVLDATDPAVGLRRESRASGTHLVLTTPRALLAGWDTSADELRPGHIPYRMFLQGLPAGTRVSVELRNRISGAESHQIMLKSGGLLQDGTAWHPWRFPEPAHRVHRLSGSVQLIADLRVPAGDTLVIDAGTTISLGPNVSIISEGRVRALGTAARPIMIRSIRAGVPWGTFALQGSGADSSRFAHIEFTQGGGALVDRVEYTGMVNVHRASAVAFDSVVFRENLRSDDAFHALHANVDLRNSRFIRANSDAVDYDISTGNIVGNVFEHSGNDALDLMSSAPVISGNRMIASGDKGISIGEASRPFVFNNFIDSCYIGIETKDRSDPIVLNNVITHSKTGLRERRKNWRYGGGGWPIIAETDFEDNQTPWKRDVYSRVTLQHVGGLDSSSDTTSIVEADASWLYQITGVTVLGTPTHGLLRNWVPTAPLAAIDEHSFVDDFGDVSDGWRMAGGVDRLEKRRDALVIEAERQEGTASRAVRWSLPTGGTLVLELAARDLRSATVTVTGRAHTVRSVIAATGDMASARFFTLTLPPGTYESLSITLRPVPGLSRIDAKTKLPVPRSARIDLRSYRVLPILKQLPLPAGRS